MRSTLLSTLILFFSIFIGYCQEVIPPVPPHYFEDYTSSVNTEDAAKLDKLLEDYERDTSNQILFVIYPVMESTDSIQSYTLRVAQKWGVGQQDKSNGIVIFVFKNEHTYFGQVGYGLEESMPDSKLKRILEATMVPQFRTGNISQGVEDGIHGIIEGLKKDNYVGNGKTVHEKVEELNVSTENIIGAIVVSIVILGVAIYFCAKGRSPDYNIYSRRGRRRSGSNSKITSLYRSTEKDSDTPINAIMSAISSSSKRSNDDDDSGSSSSSGGGISFTSGGGGFGGGGAGGTW